MQLVAVTVSSQERIVNKNQSNVVILACKERVKSSKYRRSEDVVAAALSSLAQEESFGDFAKGDSYLIAYQVDHQSLCVFQVVHGRETYDQFSSDGEGVETLMPLMVRWPRFLACILRET